MAGNCRICSRPFRAEPLLRYRNMPKAAQELPDRDRLAADRGADLEVQQCSGCGLAQLTGEPVPYYRDVIRASAFSEEMKAFRREQFAAFLRDHDLRGKRVIEIGCGKGEYLALLREAGAEAYGLEHAEASVRHCVAQGLRVSQGFIDSAGYRLAGAPFDAFCMMNFLEHLPEPNAALRGIGGNLRENAVGLVEVPNFDMILRKRLFAEFIADHLLYFTRETLLTALSLNGFEVLTCGALWHDYILSAVVRKRGCLDTVQFREHQDRLQREVDAFLGRFRPGRVAVWGAGHQALALLALLGLGGRIKYVVDSAPFKQGRYTPATHVPIVPPDELERDPADAVVVMAASYSDEVVRILAKQFVGAFPVAVVRDAGLEIVGTAQSEAR